MLDEPIEPEPNEYERGTIEATEPIRLEEAKVNQEKQRAQDQANQSSLNGNPPNSIGEI